MMDPTVQNVLLGVLTNALSAVLSATLSGTARIAVGDELSQRLSMRRTSLEPILQEAVQSLSDTIPWKGPGPVEHLCLFLASPEVEVILRRVYATRLGPSDSADPADLAELRSTFRHTLALYLDLPEDHLIDESSTIFTQLVNACNSALQFAVGQNVLTAHEAQSALRHQLLRDELSTIRMHLRLLTETNGLSFSEITNFETQYRRQVLHLHSWISPPYYDEIRRIPLDSLYIEPLFYGTKSAAASTDEGSIHNVLRASSRAVILGDPGAGKSILTQKLCQEFALSSANKKPPYNNRTPILVVVRHYETARENDKLSILRFIEETASATYQVNPPRGAVEHLLLSGRAIVLFDGLDELLEPHQRQDIRGTVELFCRMYPATQVIVTSRRVGYELAPLDPSFTLFQLRDFDPPRVRAYAKKWFDIMLDGPSPRSEGVSEAFIKESALTEDLRSNPLLLSLMCNVYMGEGYIPKNRPEIYEKCTNLLLRKWDMGRGISLRIAAEPMLEGAIGYVAYEMGRRFPIGRGVPEREIHRMFSHYFRMRRFENDEEADSLSHEILDFCRGRAWVLSEVGVTERGDRLYGFTHQTFWEYFVALHLVRISVTPEKLWKTLGPTIVKGGWPVVGELAVQMLSRRVDGGADVFLNLLRKGARNRRLVERIRLLAFALRTLDFVVPRRSSVEAVTKDWVRAWWAWEQLSARRRSALSEDERYLTESQFAHAAKLLTCAPENGPTAWKALGTELGSLIARGETAADWATQVADKLYIVPDLSAWAGAGDEGH
jgi:hypothetical protein